MTPDILGVSLTGVGVGLQTVSWLADGATLYLSTHPGPVASSLSVVIEFIGETAEGAKDGLDETEIMKRRTEVERENEWRQAELLVQQLEEERRLEEERLAEETRAFLEEKELAAELESTQASEEAAIRELRQLIELQMELSRLLMAQGQYAEGEHALALLYDRETQLLTERKSHETNTEAENRDLQRLQQDEKAYTREEARQQSEAKDITRKSDLKESRDRLEELRRQEEQAQKAALELAAARRQASKQAERAREVEQKLAAEREAAEVALRRAQEQAARALAEATRIAQQAAIQQAALQQAQRGVR
jgi:hypothetical protein